MDLDFTRRGVLQALSATAGALAAAPLAAGPFRRDPEPGHVEGKLTGALALVDALIAEGTGCVFGIPGAQENELWDAFKARGLPYLLSTHEFSAACMADGYARATGRPGVLAVVPGPGITNALTGLGEALLDSVPMVVIAGDVARGDKYRPFQVHALDGAALLRPVTKGVFEPQTVQDIAPMVRQAFRLACCGEPGPVAVLVPYNLFIEAARVSDGPAGPAGLPFDEGAFQQALALLSDRRLRVGLYAGYGCMDHAAALCRVAELLQAPVATSMSGRGVIADAHPLAVGWGYGPHGTRAAERAFCGDKLHPFAGVDCVLAVGVKYSEVSTGFYGNPRRRHQIHVDANAANLGQVVPADVCVHADAGLFFARLLEHAPSVCRPRDDRQLARIASLRAEEVRINSKPAATSCGIDPMLTVLALRRHLCDDALLLADVTMSEHLATEAFEVRAPRTYFLAADNQSMGWSVPAAIGAQRALPGRQVAALVGDGCFLMSGPELSTAARECLPVKFFVLDDRAYHYMQALQEPAYKRTTATHLARLDYAALARGWGVGYAEANTAADLDTTVAAALAHPGPVLVRVVTDYGDRKVRWIEAVRNRYTDELTGAQKARFLSRIARHSLDRTPDSD